MEDKLIEKAEQLLEIEPVREIYEKVLTMEHTFSPEAEPVDKAYILKEIIISLGEAPEIKEMAAKLDQEIDVEVPKSRSNFIKGLL